jgi:hypothetical protein
MSSFSFCSSCVRSRERRFYCDSIHFIELDFVLFCTLLRLFSLSEIQRWIVSFCDFLYVLFRFRSAIFHLSTVVSIIAESLSHTTSFQHAFRQNFWMISTSNCYTTESIKSDVMILSLLFLMLYCSMINDGRVLITFRSACLSSSCYLRSVVSNVHAISFQKICIEESSMRCWRLDCWSSAKRWCCVDVLLTRRWLSLISVMMIVCLMIFVQCNCRFSSTWSLYLEMTKILFSKKMTRSQQSEQLVRSFSSSFHQRSDVFSTQMRYYSFVLFLNAKSTWRITCHSICSSSRFLSCIETIKQNDFHRSWRTFVFQSTLCMCYHCVNSRKLRSVVHICMIFQCDHNVDSWSIVSICNSCRSIRTCDANIHLAVFLWSND